MRALTGNDVAVIREAVERIYEISVDVGLDIEIRSNAGGKNVFAKTVEFVNKNGYRDVGTNFLPARMDIKVEHGGEGYYNIVSDTHGDGIYEPLEDGCNEAIAELFEEIRGEIVCITRRRKEA